MTLKSFCTISSLDPSGGSLRHLYMFCSHYMKDELNDYREWIMYIFYPIFATGTAIVAVTLIQSGILLIEFVDFDDTPYAQISFAFFVGFGFNRFLNKLNAVSKDIFKPINSKPSTPKKKKKQPRVPIVPKGCLFGCFHINNTQ